MGANKDDKKKQEELRRQQEEDRRLSNQSITAASQPSALQAMREGAVMRWNDWKNSKGDFADKPLDIFEAPDLGPSLSMFRAAKAGQQGERQGQGLITMGANASDPGMAANLETQRALRREQDAAGALEEAVARKDAEMNETALPLMQLDHSRAMGIAGLRANQAGQSQGLWSQFRVRPSGWATFGQNLLSGAAQAGSAALGNPNLFS